ncbi:unnamed protein product [Rhizophagus irregularis]|nr:unnamed protein product [Rhizophagus irregularis]
MPKIPRVSSQGIRKILELFRFPHISTVFDVDFHVDFKRKKIPDVRLESLCELKYSKPNHRIAKLIEAQKYLKYFEWSDSFDDYFKDDDPYEQILLPLEKKVESLNYLNIFFQDVEDYKRTLLHEILYFQNFIN